jgi:hypothetical protein
VKTVEEGAGPFRDPGGAAAQRALELRGEVTALEAELTLVRARRLDLEHRLRQHLLTGRRWPAGALGFVIGLGLAAMSWLLILAHC